MMIRNIIKTSAAIIAIAFSGAAISYHVTRAQPYRQFLIEHGFIDAYTSSSNIDRIEEAQVIECGHPENVIFIIGQSNVANKVDSLSGTFPEFVLNYYDGQCYNAADPLLGSSGTRGSLWSQVDWKASTVLVPLAIGGSYIQQWRPGGQHWLILASELHRLKALELEPTHIFIHQGEEDGMESTDPQQYYEDMVALLSALKERSNAKIVVGQTSFCRGVDNPAIIAAQARAVLAAGVILGPNTDRLGSEMRYDDCHLNAAGAKVAAAEWQTFLD